MLILLFLDLPWSNFLCSKSIEQMVLKKKKSLAKLMEREMETLLQQQMEFSVVDLFYPLILDGENKGFESYFLMPPKSAMDSYSKILKILLNDCKLVVPEAEHPAETWE